MKPLYPNRPLGPQIADPFTTTTCYIVYYESPLSRALRLPGGCDALGHCHDIYEWTPADCHAWRFALPDSERTGQKC